ncbi:SIS domain-containing protein [Candidatus Saccharibacteria bacterium]|nr:SIS domain-containing protein [Candidatus Saccharibacteria bacterium]
MDIFTMIDSQPAQLRQDYFRAKSSDKVEGITRVVVAGMGGSALGAEIVKEAFRNTLRVPLEISRGYSVSEMLDEHTLFIASSYSGNTEETLACLEQAIRLNTQLAVITSGGKLLEEADQRGIDIARLAPDFQPRLAVFANLKALMEILDYYDLLEFPDIDRELLDLANWLDVHKAQFSLDNTGDNQVKDLASKLVGKTPLIYSSSNLQSAGYKWKIDINENAKNLAFYNYYPELNHNEMNGWILPESKDNVVVVQLSSNLDNGRNLQRMHLMPKLLESHGFKHYGFKAPGQTYLQQLFMTILAGDYLSAYLAELNHVDAIAVELVEKFKAQL